jgi:hypothetical protein
MKKQIRKTGRFVTRGSDGKNYTVVEYTEFIDVTTISDTETQWSPGMKIMKLENGEHVNPVDGGGFEIVRTGVRLSRADA